MAENKGLERTAHYNKLREVVELFNMRFKILKHLIPFTPELVEFHIFQV